MKTYRIMNFKYILRKRVEQKIVLLFALILCLAYTTSAQYNKRIKENAMIYRYHISTVNDIDVHPDGRYFVSCGSDRKIFLWDNNSQIPVREFFGHSGAVNAVRFINNGKYIVSGGDDKEIKIWDTESGVEVNKIKSDDFGGVYLASITALAVDRNNEYLVSGHSDNTIRIWKISDLFSANAHKPKIINGHTWTVTDIAFLPNSETFISTSGNNEMKQWTINGAPRNNYGGHLGWINSVDCSVNNYIVSAGNDKRIIRRDVNNGKIQKIFYTDTTINAVKNSPNEEYIASASDNGLVEIWVVKTGEKHLCIGHHGSVRALAFTPDGKYLLSGGTDNTIRRWRADDISSKLYFKKEIKAKLDTAFVFREKSEYETKKEFQLRKATWGREREKIFALYRKAYSDMIKGNQHNLTEQTSKTLHKVKLKIDSISEYYPEIEERYFTLWLSVIRTKTTANKKYEEMEGPLYIPRDEAISFKTNGKYKKAIITGQAYKIGDSGTYHVTNIEINHPILKKKYKFGFTPKKDEK